MTAAQDAVQPNKPIAKRHSMGEVFRSLRRPRVLAMLLLGFSCGVPFLLVGNTLGFWLREAGLTLTAIGFLSWVGLAYSFKFLWAPVVDRVDVPLLGRFGRRRGWMVLAQLGVGVLAGHGADPDRGAELARSPADAVAVAFSSATQDIVVDAWRIEVGGNLRRARPDDLRPSARLSWDRALLHRRPDLVWPSTWAGTSCTSPRRRP